MPTFHWQGGLLLELKESFVACCIGQYSFCERTISCASYDHLVARISIATRTTQEIPLHLSPFSRPARAFRIGHQLDPSY